jgi:hypothetical protein
MDIYSSRGIHMSKYRQKISSYKIVFYDMDNNVVDIPERAMSQAYSEIDQAIYDWEITHE